MARPKSSEPKVKLQNWVSAAQAAAIKAYLQGGAWPAVEVPSGTKLPAGGAEKNSTASPSGSSQGGPGAADLSAALARSNEQLRLQTQRADDLQTQVDELNEACEHHLLRIEELMQTGGTERQSAYIAQLLAKIQALGGNRGEFDQEGGR